MLERNNRENERPPRTVPKGRWWAARRNQVRLFYISFFCSFLISLVIYLYLVLFPLTSVYAAFYVDLTTGRHVELVFFNSMHFAAGSARSRGFSETQSSRKSRHLQDLVFKNMDFWGDSREEKRISRSCGTDADVQFNVYLHITRVPI